MKHLLTKMLQDNAYQKESQILKRQTNSGHENIRNESETVKVESENAIFLIGKTSNQ